MNRDQFDELVGILRNAVAAEVETAVTKAIAPLRADLSQVLGENLTLHKRVTELEQRVAVLETKSSHPPEAA